MAQVNAALNVSKPYPAQRALAVASPDFVRFEVSPGRRVSLGVKDKGAATYTVKVYLLSQDVANRNPFIIVAGQTGDYINGSISGVVTVEVEVTAGTADVELIESKL